MQSEAELLDYLAGGGLVVAASPRAARALRRQYSLWQRGQGKEAWSAPEIHDWENWLGQLWNEHAFSNGETRLVLSDLQERELWARIIGGQPEARWLVRADGMAKLAQEAYERLCEYDRHEQLRFPWSVREEEPRNDAEPFRRWALAFDQECRRQGWLSRSQLSAALAPQFSNKTLTAPPEVLLLGFDRVTPAQERLLDSIQQAGGDWRHFLLANPAPEGSPVRITTLVEATDLRDELTTCALWLRDRMALQPSQRIAVLASDVGSMRGKIDRTFRRILAPESMEIGIKARSLPYEFAVGEPLSHVPVVRAALLLLRWLMDPLLEAEVSWLTGSGFVARSEGETSRLAQVDALLRERHESLAEWPLDTFLSQPRYASHETGRDLQQRLRQMLLTARREGFPQRDQTALAWTELSVEMLTQAGWPGVTPPDTLQFQAQQKWEQLLTTVAALSFDGGRVSFSDFLRLLQRQADETIFAPQSQGAPVQIMGPFESSGQVFDAVWFLGADEENWPAGSRPHPLLPIAIQRAAGMPHASVEIDWEVAQAATERIAKSAAVCVFSYSAQNDNGEMRVSPLVRHVVAGEPRSCEALRNELGVTGQNVSTADAVSALEDAPESEPMPWPAERVAGGSSVLTKQSACAFQAFASTRLHAQELNRAEWGLSAVQRGELLHRVMERLWCNEFGLRSLDALKNAFEEDELAAQLAHHIDDVFASHKATRSAEGWMLAYLETEKTRLRRLLSTWLEYESQREPFEVEACEKEIKALQVGDLRLDVRLDRVDTLPDGRKLLIDYKTGRVSARKWEGERPDEPQLPLYALHGGLGHVAGVLFAQIRADGSAFVGNVENAQQTLMADLTARSGLVKNPYTAEMSEQWDAALHALAEAYLRGDAAVEPKDYPKTCEHCGLQSLCRVAETNEALLAAQREGSAQHDSDEENGDD